jgi:hypothetical protein
MAARLSTLLAGRPLPPEDSLYLFLLEAESTPQGHSAAGMIRSTQKSSDLIGNRPPTFRIVAECLNELLYRVPLSN